MDNEQSEKILAALKRITEILDPSWTSVMEEDPSEKTTGELIDSLEKVSGLKIKTIDFQPYQLVVCFKT